MKCINQYIFPVCFWESNQRVTYILGKGVNNYYVSFVYAFMSALLDWKVKPYNFTLSTSYTSFHCVKGGILMEISRKSIFRFCCTICLPYIHYSYFIYYDINCLYVDRPSPWAPPSVGAPCVIHSSDISYKNINCR